MSTKDDFDQAKDVGPNIVDLDQRRDPADHVGDWSRIVEEGVGEIMGQATPSKVVEADDHEAVKQEVARKRTRHFAFGLFFVALFLVSLTSVLPEKDGWLWAGASFVILIVAAWHWDRSRPDVD